MSKVYSIQKNDNGIVYIHFFSVPDLKTFEQGIEELTKMGKAPRRLVDFRGVEIDIDMPTQNAISEVIRKAPMYPRRTAILVDNPLTFARVRQFMSYREEEVIERAIFEDEAAAVEWLLG